MKRKSDKSLPAITDTNAAAPTVLVVDHDGFMRQVFREALAGIGCRVTEASCGIEAIEIFQGLNPDLVVLDLVMPGMDGFETCSRIRGLIPGENTPILAITGLQDTDSIHRAFEAGATDFISKPVSGELLGYRALFMLRAGRTLEELAGNEANLRLLRTAVESLPIGLTISDPEGKIIYASPAEARMHGYEVEELLNQDVRIMAPRHLHHVLPPGDQADFEVWRRESVNVCKDGQEFPVQLSSVALRGADGDFLGVISSCEDITDRKKRESEIHRLAYFDAVTGLPNRALLMDRLEKALAQASRSSMTVAVLLLDLDHFKDINYTQGHDYGDQVLRKVSRRLSDCIRKADTLARFGGDEFAVIQIAADGKETASKVALRVLEAFQAPLEIGGRRIHAGFSIGIAIYPGDAPDSERLLRNTETAMYQAKARGRNNFQFFSAEMNKEIVEKFAMEGALRRAIEQQELSLFYQPQWDLGTGRYCGMEALLRWHHPTRGAIPPARFIPLAESNGQIVQLGEWALRSACFQASAWAKAGLSIGRMAVNISGHQLRRPDFPEVLGQILEESGLAPSTLELEFTESVLIENAEQTIEMLRGLKNRGIHLSLDDFGTGYSSLSYLRHLPVDRLKIDRSFVAAIDSERGDSAIIEAIIALARSLKIRVLAEGVETRYQLRRLKNLGSNEVQGYLLGSPMEAEELARLIGSRFPEDYAYPESNHPAGPVSA